MARSNTTGIKRAWTPRYKLLGYLVLAADIEPLAYNPHSQYCQLFVEFKAGGSKLSICLNGADAFALRLWLGKQRSDLKQFFEEIEERSRSGIQQLTLIENSGIHL